MKSDNEFICVIKKEDKIKVREVEFDVDVGKLNGGKKKKKRWDRPSEI